MKEKELQSELLRKIKKFCYNVFKEEERISIIGTIGIKLSEDRIMLLSINEDAINKDSIGEDMIEVNESDDTDDSDSNMNGNNDNNFQMLSAFENSENSKRFMGSSLKYESNIESDKGKDCSTDAHQRNFKSITESSKNMLFGSNKKYCNHLSTDREQQLDEQTDCENPEHECQICGKCCTTKYGLKLHQVVHSTEKPFKCPYCNAEFKWKNSYGRHKKLVHDKLKRGLSESTKTSVSGKTESNFDSPFNCKDCGKVFQTHHYLKVHRVVVHSALKPFVCSICNASFKWKYSFERHQRLLHGATNRNTEQFI
ncbi:DgyrCDS12902 [Dimorphilus gyrociliatus]|uniref:DgyrCDS12902 n=1 Tax=Dimorphilus gyrociliatus TaxID=2664684 RepID=A0A7I8W946_9ANNE|nr:DgyrCDS12902 [Dimorphilus gyrociliatus]